MEKSFIDCPGRGHAEARRRGAGRRGSSASPRLRVPTLVIGYGNPDRGDDGVALHVINLLRKRVGLPSQQVDSSGIQTCGSAIDPVFIRQLAPEHLSVALPYDRIIFVDAHLPSLEDDIRFGRILPGNGCFSLTHQLSPDSFLAWLETLYKHKPEGYILSIKAHRFDFESELSSETRMLVGPALDTIIQFLAHPHPGPFSEC